MLLKCPSCGESVEVQPVSPPKKCPACGEAVKLVVYDHADTDGALFVLEKDG